MSLAASVLSNLSYYVVVPLIVGVASYQLVYVPQKGWYARARHVTLWEIIERLLKGRQGKTRMALETCRSGHFLAGETVAVALLLQVVLADNERSGLLLRLGLCRNDPAVV